MTFQSPITSLILEEQPVDWTVVLLTHGHEYVLDQWTAMNITDTMDGPRASIEVNGLEPMLVYIRELVTDMLWYRNDQLLYRMRVIDADDTFTRDAHIVKFECVGYEKLLDRRILYEDWVVVDGDMYAGLAVHQLHTGQGVVGHHPRDDGTWRDPATRVGRRRLDP